MGKHGMDGADGWPTGPAGFPAEAWEHPDVRESASAFWQGVQDWAEDGDLSEPARERMRRAGRTLVQNMGAAVLLGVAPLAWDLVRNGDALADPKGALYSLGTAALGAVISYFHTRRN